ncbi:SDR family oxidoreductase [Amycolatopsis sp. NBRC 101858]|uniref:SDR family oxidoreductase n=1 Tax=Amycolatopsis sp. NBRC 101858 TaxID=3032200 RepID=UPI002553EA94|nr:SDR family oxidoreductase [Amycolatopsis sp. NBRC 101858]
MTVALVTNVTQYAGPAGAGALAADGFRVVCHDETFTDAEVRDKFAAGNPDLTPVAEQEAAALLTAAGDHGSVDVVLSNDYVPPAAVRTPFDGAPLGDLEFLMRRLVYRPFELIQAATPAMKAGGGGRIILMTSAVAVRPLATAVLYSAARAAATTMTTAAAKALGEHNIQLNAIGPNWFENPTYFPPGLWESDADLRATVAKEVPLQRLGRQEEMGALIAFLASGKATPVTGQFFGFTGGWLP